jgi:N-acyl homoserine lactone hydrolase
MEILPIQTGTARIKPSQIRAKGRGDERIANLFADPDWVDVPILAWAILHPDGVILVDTGETSRGAEPGYYPMEHPYYQHAFRADVTPDDDIAPQLLRHGITASDVRTVLLTHLHTDHAGGLHAFPHAKVFVHQVEHEQAQGEAGLARGYLAHHLPPWYRPHFYDFAHDAAGSLGRTHVVTRAADVRVVATPGHTSGHVSVLVAGDGADYLLAGDMTYTEETLLDEALDAVSSDEEQARDTMRKVGAYLRAKPTVYLPTHDAASIERLRRKTTTQPR